MLIISKYKDYYDYLSGINGIDRKVVLDRRKGFVLYPEEIYTKYHSGYDEITLAICDKLYTGLIGEERIYWLKEAKSCGKYERSYFPSGYRLVYDTGFGRWDSINIEITPTDINENTGCPVVLLGYEKRLLFPRLSDLEVARIYPAEKIHQDIYNWISKRNEPVITDNRTDIQKLESAGFDKITSFRNIK